MKIQNQNKPLSVKLHEEYRTAQRNQEFENALSENRIKSLRGWTHIDIDSAKAKKVPAVSFSISDSLFSRLSKIHAAYLL